MSDLPVILIGENKNLFFVSYRSNLTIIDNTMKTFIPRPIVFSKAVTAGIIISLLLCCVPELDAQNQADKEISLFDGKTLTGWKVTNPADKDLWKVVDSVITGGDGTHKIKSNSYLQTEQEYGDFEFRCLFKLSGDSRTGMINSGIQYRSKVIDNNMVGYQADIGNGYWGDIYDEHRRGKLVGGDMSVLKLLLREDGWNSYIIRVKGNHHTLYINGVKTSEYTEKDASVPDRGIIAIQLHSGGAATIQFRDVVIQPL